MRYSEITESVDYDLKAKYNTFNKAYFDGMLPDIPVEWAKMKRAGGVAKASIIRNGPAPDPRMVRLGRISKYHNAAIKPGSLKIQMSDLFKRSEEGLDGILLHEMIHIYFFVTGKFEENHGVGFNSMRRKISQISGINVPRTDSKEGLELSDDKVLTPYGVILTYNYEGKAIFSLISAKNAHSQSQQIKDACTRALRASFPKVELYVISTALWTKIGASVPINRNILRPKAYVIPEPQAALADLLAHGHKLWSVGQ